LYDSTAETLSNENLVARTGLPAVVWE